NPRNEVVVVNRKVNFAANKLRKVAPAPQTVFDMLEIDMTTRVGYTGEPRHTMAPEDFKNGLGAVFNKMGINWETHVDPAKPKKSQVKSFSLNYVKI
ncbi:MAG: hypothetical protein K6E29_09725, partial [Cyanobacteria bacterium RUI128]|nr:hypothetical protein [Cyanobacteria bacterium RUI128]